MMAFNCDAQFFREVRGLISGVRHQDHELFPTPAHQVIVGADQFTDQLHV